MQHVSVTRRILETSVRIMLLCWVHLAWCRTITFPHVERVSHLIPFHALLLATTLEMSPAPDQELALCSTPCRSFAWLNLLQFT